MKSIVVSCEISSGLLCGAVNCFRRLILLPRSFALKSVFIRGIPAYGAGSFSLIYLGEGASLEHLKNFYFQKIEEEKGSKLSLLSLRKKIGGRDGNILLFVEINRALDFLVPKTGFRTFPWIRQRVFLKSKVFQSRRRSIEDNYGRKVRKFHYAFRITRIFKDVTKFYRELYVPYMRDRYKDSCHLRSLEDFLTVLNSGFLLEVLEENRLVAGIMCQRRRKGVTAFAFGLLPDYGAHLHKGALSATYYFLFQWARDNNITTIDLLRSRPHSLDGVYEHKRRWGAVAQDDGWPPASVWIFPPRKTELPLIFQKQLIWENGALVELGAGDNRRRIPG